MVAAETTETSEAQDRSAKLDRIHRTLLTGPYSLGFSLR